MKFFKRLFIIILLSIIIIFAYNYFTAKFKSNTIPQEEKNKDIQTSAPAYNEPEIKTVTISAVGDCTIGWDPRYGYETRYDKYLDDNNGDYGYYFAKVKDLFSKDDLTIANLECVFTNSKNLVPKEFNLSSPPEFKEVLPKGNIDIVSFANNHTHDYGEEGYQDTLNTLDSINMPYYGYDKYLIKEVNGIKIGFFALLDIDCKNYNDIDTALSYLKEQNCDLIICSMHWGIEGDYKQSNAQVEMGHYLIDNGVDLVLGSHPHRIQGIEKYNDRFIVYSMANFTFGGNQNPNDKDTLIFQETFTFKDGKLILDDNIKIIPASQSGVSYTNNYQPIILEGTEKDRVLHKILKYSSGFEYSEEKITEDNEDDKNDIETELENTTKSV